MKTLSFKLISLGVAFTMLFAPFTSQARTGVNAARGPAAQAQPVGFRKVIAPPGVLDTSQEGITLWHDYGAFALYKVSQTTLNQLPGATRAKIEVAPDMDNVLLDAYPFNTQTDTFDAIPESFRVAQADGPALHLIQFVGPIKDAWLQAIEDAGAKPVHYIANYGYLVWADSAARARLDKMAGARDFVQFSAPYQPYFKLGASLDKRLTGPHDPEEIIKVTIQMYDHPGKDDTERLIADLAREQLSHWTPILDYQNVTILVRAGDLEAIATRPDVFWIGEYFERELLDEVQNQILAANFDGSQSGPSGPGYLAWLTGYGFSTDPADYPIVDVTDDGIGNGSVNSGDYTLYELGNIANPTRLQYVGNCTSSADGGGPDGHGHINVSIVGGYDALTGFPYQDPNGFNRGLGVSPYSRLAGTRVFDASGFDLSACGNSDTGLIKRVQDSGAQIASNSWGCGACASSYDASSQAFDTGVRDADLTEAGNQELIFIFAAGNDGSGAGTVGTPGNGKNMITVGASENDRPSDEDGSWTDGCGVGLTGADDAMDVIGFSSRGPAPGGRVKPEVIAPGTHIQGTASTHASYNGSGVCDQYRPSGQTIFAASSGTSHSTPAVAGVSSLYYYWLENVYNTIPSPALMKAYLIAHPTYLTGVSANDTLPSNNQGYGMPNMALAFDETPRHMVNQTELFDNSGETWAFSGSVADPSKPVRVVMAYTDEPGAIGTSPEVNNLNLEVTAGGSTYLGNNFSGQWSVTGGSADDDNNYEAVFLPAGTSGQIDVTITAFNIAGDGVPNTGDATDQDFALVIYNISQGDLGYLDGTIYNGDGTPATDPISGADVQADGLAPTHTGHATSLADGTYRMGLVTDTYTVTVTAYGYETAEISNVSVVSGTTTTLNIPLTPAAMVVVSGTVTDATTGWPLYAGIDIPGYPGGTVWTDPETGFYSVTLPGGSIHPFDVNAWADGYDAASRDVGPLTTDATEDFALNADLAACTAPGYTQAAPTNLFFDDFESGMGNWTLTGLWNEENEADTCGSQVAPFPGSSADAYYGQDGICTYNTGSSTTGSLQMNSAIALPASGEVRLSFWSYEHTENFSGYDRRLVEINVDGGGWTQLDELSTEQTWYQQQHDLSPYLGSNVQFRFTFDSVDSLSNNYFGWMVDDVAIFVPGVCAPQAGGLVIGNVYDADAVAPLAGATVSNDSGGSATTETTPDPVVDDSFYTLFSPAGSHTFTATMSGGHSPDTAVVTVVQSDTVRQDFYLPTASLSHDPQTLQATLLLGASVTTPFTLTNEGEGLATFELQEEEQGVEIASLSAVQVPGCRVSEPKDEESYADQHLSSCERWAYQPATDAFISSIEADILLVAAGDATQIQAILQAYPDVNAVDYFDAQIGTPTLSDLLAYDTAIVFSNYEFDDPTALGDVLADYVDVGGTVIQAVPTFYGSGWGLQGRFVDEGYGPFVGTGDWFSWADLGDFDPAHPIMQGVTTAGDDLRQIVNLNTGADWVADWTDDEFVATKGSVVALNTYLADGYSWTGDVDVIVHNSVIWLQTAADVPWLSEDPITGTVAAGGSQVIDVTFDASAVTEVGQYYATLHVISNDPVNPDQTVPVTMTVQPDPSMGQLHGAVTSDKPGGPLEDALVEVISGTVSVISGTTDATGGYGPWWLTDGTYTVRISADGYLTDTQSVSIVADGTTTHNVTLTSTAPQIEVTPVSFDETLNLGTMVTREITITNNGLAPLEFEISEEQGGFSPLAASCSETYGSWDGGTWDGGSRDRGNIFHADFSTTLSEIRFYLDFAASTDMYFVVYESDTLTGSYTKIHETFIASTGFGEDWYSSGPIAVSLSAGRYYYVGASWNGTATYGRGTDSVPMPATCMGTLETGVPVNSAGYPPGSSFTNSYTGFSPYYMHLEFGSDDVPWLFEDPITGTVAADASQVIDVTFDASAVTEVGQYYAALHVISNDSINPDQTVPVTMTVQPDPSMGQLHGTVTGDRPGGPLDGALVEVISGTVSIISGTTDATGDYGSWWMTGGTYTVRVSADGYLTDTLGVGIIAQQTTTHNVTLTLNAPQIEVTPVSFDETLDLGTSVTHTLTISNAGTLPLEFDIYEVPGGYNPLLAFSSQGSTWLPPDIPTVQVMRSTADELVLDVHVAGLTTDEVEQDGAVYQRLRLPYSGATSEVGRPELPTFGRFLALPQGAQVQVEVLDAASETIPNVLIYPAQEPQPDGSPAQKEPSFAIDEDLYAQDALYPGLVASADETKNLRGCQVTVIRFYPYQYNPARQELTTYSHLRVRVRFVGARGPFIDERYRASSFENLYRRLLLNYEQLGTPRPSIFQDPESATGAEFLIITHPDFEIAADALAAWRNAQGIDTEVRTTDDTGTTAASIRAYIQNAYDTWSPAPEFVLFLGDAEFVPTNYQTVHPYHGTLIGTDLYYATMDGSDHYPDIHTGRISVDTASEAQKAIDDIIDYDRNPVSDEAFYDNISVAAYFQDYDDYDGYEDRRFVLTSEEIRDYLLTQGYTVERIYYTEPGVNPTNYNNDYYASGEPLPPELLRPTFAWDGDSSDISTAVADGRFILNHRDHGATWGWGDPYYDVGDVQALTNGNKLPVVFSLNCQTGWFDNETDDPADGTGYTAIHFSEAWQRNPDGGAVGVIGATRVSYSGYNDWMTEGFYDAIWPDFLAYNDPGFSLPEYRMGVVLDYGKLAMAALWADWDLEFEIFHYFGDPTMGIHTTPPAEADVPWLSESPISGTVAANNALSVDVMFDAEAVSEYGTYTAHLLVGSNDAYNPDVSIPVTMTVVPSPAPALGIAKSGNPTSVQAGGLLVYTIAVGNTGNADATGATVTDTVPANTTFVSADAGGTLVGNRVQWTGKTVPAGGTLTLHFIVRVDSPLPNGIILSNDAYGVTCAEGVSATGSPVQTTVHSTPVLGIAKSGNPDPVQAGGLLTYTIAVGNTGNADATGATVTDTVPANTTFVSADAGGTLVGNRVQWTGKTVPAGGTLTLHFIVRVDSPLPNGIILSNDAYGVTCAEGVSATGSPVTIPVENGWVIYLPLTMRNH